MFLTNTMNLNKTLVLIALLVLLQACTSIKAPYSTILQPAPTTIRTSVGNVGLWKMGKAPSLEGSVYLIPGIPGSSLENAPLGRELARKGYSVNLLNPPGHGQIAVGNTHWNYTFPQYGQALYDSIQTLEVGNIAKGERIIIAHSAGAEMVFELLQNQIKRDTLPKHYKIVLINPWLPSLSNHAISWTSEDEDILKYPSWLVKLFGPASKATAHKRLFHNPLKNQNTDYLNAHEKLTENLGGWWPFDDRFVRLMKATTRSQRTILQQGSQYELTKNATNLLNKKLTSAKVRLIVISSAKGFDQIIPSTYKQSLKKALRAKLPTVSIRFAKGIEGGHMLQVEQLKRVVGELL